MGFHLLRHLSLVAAPYAVVGSGAALADLPPGSSFMDDDGNPHEGFIEAFKEADAGAGPSELATVAVTPRDNGLGGIDYAIAPFHPAPGSPALGNGEPLPGFVPESPGRARVATVPTLGAIESDS